MAKGSDVVEAVHLSVLRGNTPEESRRIAEEVGEHEYQQPYIDRLRAGAIRLMRERLQEMDTPVMNLAALRQVLESSARLSSPLEADAIRQIADAAAVSRTEVLQAHQERHEVHMRAKATLRDAAVWSWEPSGSH